MVAGPSADAALPYRLRKTIQSIKEIVGNHSDDEIYSVLKETDMDPNETAQKLLAQDPFHEVKRKKDKKKENNVLESKNLNEHTGPMIKPQGMWERNGRRGVYSRNASRGKPLVHGINREFRIVRDNRVNQNASEEMKPASQDHAASNLDQVVPGASSKSSSTSLSKERHYDTRSSELQVPSRGDMRPRDSTFNHPVSTDSSTTRRQILVGEKRAIVPRSDVRLLGQRSNNSSSSTTFASSNSVVGVYSKSTDPIHVPSQYSRPSGSIGAIRREVGVVGIRKHSTQNSASQSMVQSSALSAPVLSKGNTEPAESFGQISRRPMKGEQFNQATATPTVNVAYNKTSTGNQHGAKVSQQTHQRSSLPYMEWKPKSTQKLNVNSNDGGKSAVSISSSADDDSSRRKTEASDLPGKLSEVTLSTDEHVIIAQHLQVPEADRCRLTFGSFGVDVESSNGSGPEFQVFRDELEQKNDHSSFSNPIATINDTSGGDGVDLLVEDHDLLVEDHVRMAGSESPASNSVLEANQPDKRYSASPQNLNDYSDIGLVRSESTAHAPVELQQEEDVGALTNFSEYDSQIGYDSQFFKPVSDENMRQGLASPQEALGSHPINGGPASSSNLMQQQHSITQMYPQVHLSHIPNFIPYRPMYPPVYVPPMAVPSFSNNPAYPHPSNGNNYLVMPGGSSHMSTGNIKYTPSQFKGAPPGGPVGYGSFTNPTGFISTPGVVGPTGLDDVLRTKYKDGNMFLPNPQVETSEMWIQTPREVSGMQSGPYYNLSGQAPHAAYLHSPAGPTSYNTPAPQSPHLPFPGLYHQPQPPTMTNPHPMVHGQLPPMGGNVPGAQVGAYQQPQLGWNTNY